MKKIFVYLALVLALSTLHSLSVLAGGERLYDGADLLSDAEEAELLAQMDRVSDTYGVEIVIATFESLDGESVDDFVESYYDNGGYGIGDRKSGVLFLIDMEWRDWRILSNGIGADAVSDGDIDSIGSAAASYLTDEDYYTAFETFIEQCEYEIDGEINGFPFKAGTNLIISLVIGFVVAFIVTGIWRGQLKSVRSRADAEEYTKSGSMNIRSSRDIFLYRNVTRTKKESSSSSSGGGSSRNVGGGKF